jgi:RNA polymerase sigma factor (sigma-70 family)
MTAPSPPTADPADPAQQEVGAWAARYGSALRAYFVKRAPRADPDDLVQDVFLRLHSRSEREVVENPERYIFKIASSVLIDRHRHELARGLGLHDGLDGEGVLVDELSPERTLIGRQEHARAIQALSNLPPRARAAFALHRFEHMTYAAIAQRMGISINGVKHLIARALERLNEQVGQS